MDLPVSTLRVVAAAGTASRPDTNSSVHETPLNWRLDDESLGCGYLDRFGE